MEFRWAAAIALWTMLSGPVFVQVRTIGQPHSRPAVQNPSPKHFSGNSSAKQRFEPRP